jgi:hypothetical protein
MVDSRHGDVFDAQLPIEGPRLNHIRCRSATRSLAHHSEVAGLEPASCIPSGRCQEARQRRTA